MLYRTDICSNCRNKLSGFSKTQTQYTPRYCLDCMLPKQIVDKTNRDTFLDWKV